jgi:hypothetical protein
MHIKVQLVNAVYSENHTKPLTALSAKWTVKDC